MSRTSLLVPLLGVVTVVTSPASAQAAPEVRVVTISSFRVPQGEDRQRVLDYMKKWMVEPAKVNPSVLSYRIIQHFYGSNAGDIAIVAEYATWAAITADCPPCDKWSQDNMPKEGTPERKVVDDLAALFFKYYGSHADQIYNADMSLAKR